MHQQSKFCKGFFGCSKEVEHFIMTFEDEGTIVHKESVADCCLAPMVFSGLGTSVTCPCMSTSLGSGDSVDAIHIPSPELDERPA